MESEEQGEEEAPEEDEAEGDESPPVEEDAEEPGKDHASAATELKNA